MPPALPLVAKCGRRQSRRFTRTRLRSEGLLPTALRGRPPCSHSAHQCQSAPHGASPNAPRSSTGHAHQGAPDCHIHECGVHRAAASRASRRQSPRIVAKLAFVKPLSALRQPAMVEWVNVPTAEPLPYLPSRGTPRCLKSHWIRLHLDGTFQVRTGDYRRTQPSESPDRATVLA